MGTFLLVLFIVVLLVAGMSIGVIFGRKPISGTCGGIGAWASALPVIFAVATPRNAKTIAKKGRVKLPKPKT